MVKQLNIIQALEKIVQWRRANYPEDAYISSGLTVRQLHNIIDGFPFKLPRELIDFYTHCSTNISLAPGLGGFNSLIESLRLCLEHWILPEIPDLTISFSKLERQNLVFFEGCYREELYKRILENYPHNWCRIPIFAGSCKEAYLIKCDRQEVDYSPVWVRFIGCEPIEYASSLTNLMLTIAECYETGAYYKVFHEEYGEWEIEEDLEKVELIFEKYNPEYIDTWRHIHKD